ncbi:MAG: GTP-binding protein [Candidatus Tectomicrobia bacterium]|uniref:GTP-binding protein n=1 Tax=Tectimicrobiota bacterium TaxID=2528274 RepID=A0A937VZ03_UNCTE|nr:GTP-binding protein [Candidatus Tectomicrobia bacterium]
MGDTRIPVLVVSGFLGAGKTTLVRHLLQDAQQTGVRVAVISNEFGALGIDKALLGEGEAAYVELEGGCVCCQLSDTLVETLQMLWERVRPERVIIETSGIALPFDTQMHLWREPVCHWVGEDVAVVVVNAEQVLEGRDLAGTFTDQVSSADFLLLNKVDLIPEAALPQVEACLQDLAPDIPRVHSSHGQVDPTLLFPPDLRSLPARQRTARAVPLPHQHDRFVAQEMRIATGVEPETLCAQLAQLGALRVKGFVQTAQGLRLLQGVGHRLELTAVSVAPPAHLLGRLVVITRSAPSPEHGISPRRHP